MEVSGRCFVGSVLIARGNKPRHHHEIKRETRILSEYNRYKTIFDNSAECKIVAEIDKSKITDAGYSLCILQINKRGLKIKNIPGDSMSAKEICCESENYCKPTKGKFCSLKGRIALGVEFHRFPFVPSYKKSERYKPN